MKYANLHLHSIYSDGVLTPTELVIKAKEMGYGAIALSDHYACAGCKEIKTAAKEHGLESIVAMETVGRAFEHNFHIVAYDFDPSEKNMSKYIEDNRVLGYNVTKQKFEGMKANGLLQSISWKDITEAFSAEAWLCNEQIFAVAVERGLYSECDYYTKFIPAFRAVKTDYRSNGLRPTAQEMIDIIRGAGGVASVAHPHGVTQHLEDLYKMGVRAVEYDHPDIDDYDSKMVLEFISRHDDVYACGGTDHTGRLANNASERGTPDGADFLIPLDADVTSGVTKEEFLALKNRIYG